MRNLDLARLTLEKDLLHVGQHDTQEALLRLQIAQDAMKRMAVIIRRWMYPDNLKWNTLDTSQTLGNAIDQAVQHLSPTASLCQADIQVRLSEEAARLPADGVYTIVANALQNSIQAIANVHRSNPLAQWQIEVKARLVDGHVEVNVQDNGPGLDTSIIDDQGQVRLGLTTKPDGFGIGLTLCQDIATNLGGQITLVHRPPHGATFTLRYPWVAPKNNGHRSD